MERVATMIRIVILLLCVALFLAGAIWSMKHPPEQVAVYEAAEAVTATPSLQPIDEHLEESAEPEQREQQTMEDRIAALRMERDDSWQQLYLALDGVDPERRQTILQQYTELQYKEQRLELLISAKGIAHCLVVLEPEHANIVVPAEVAKNQYEKLFDLVRRNTTYAETNIIIVPLQE